MYKALAKPHLDYCDITFEEIYHSSFHQKLELFQYNSCAAITGAIRVTSTAYQELGLESLQQGRWFSRLSSFYKIS